MNVKATKAKIIIGAIIVSVVLAAGAAALARNDKPSTIPPMSSLEDTRALSKGEKDACLENNEQARDAVKKDDTFVDNDEQYSRFELTASEGIMDVPAGTNYEVTVNSYDGSLVKGALAYEKDYGTYNYTIKKLANAGQWEFVSMIACE